MTKVFVYGTLRKGFSNHDIIKEGNNKFLNKDETIDKYLMLDTGGFPAVIKNIPYHNIVGELYEVDNETFESIDKLESNGNLFQREKVILKSDNEAWMYFYLPENFVRSFLMEDLVFEGDYSNKSKNSFHDIFYNTKEFDDEETIDYNEIYDSNKEILDEILDYFSPQDLHTIISIVKIMDKEEINHLRYLSDTDKEILLEIKDLEIE